MKVNSLKHLRNSDKCKSKRSNYRKDKKTAGKLYQLDRDKLWKWKMPKTEKCVHLKLTSRLH